MKTGGYEAEFGQSTGGVVNVITKSGSNAVKGSAFYYDRPSGLEGTGPRCKRRTARSRRPGRAVTTAASKEAARFSRTACSSSARSIRRATCAPSRRPQGFPLLSLGDVDRRETASPTLRRRRCKLKNGQRIDASFFGDPSKGPNGPQRASAMLNQTTAGFSSLDYGGHNQTIRYDGAVRPNLAARGVLRACVEQHRGDAIRGRVGRDRQNRHAERHLLAGLGSTRPESKQQLSVGGQGHQLYPRPRDQVRLSSTIAPIGMC